MSMMWLSVIRCYCSRGDKIPADGILHEGSLRVNNSALNGEAEECEKKAAGENVYLAEEITGDTFVDSYSLFRGAVIFDGRCDGCPESWTPYNDGKDG